MGKLSTLSNFVHFQHQWNDNFVIQKLDLEVRNEFLDLPGVVCFHAEIYDQSMYALPTPSSTGGCFFMPLDAGDG